MKIQVDTSEVRSAVADLNKVPTKLLREVPAVVKKGALNIKNAMRKDFEASNNAGFQYVGSTVTFDMTDQGFGAEIGPAKPRGALANVAWFGTSRGGGTVRDPAQALAAEEPKFIEQLERIVGDLF